jgi:hypothetical protein
MSASGQGLIYEILDQPHKGSLVSDSNGNYTYTPDGGVLGMDQFRFRVRNTSGQQSVGTVSVFIDGRLRIMPLGDSITQGIIAGDSPMVTARVGYRRKLFNALENLSSGYGVNFLGSIDSGHDATPPLGDDDHEGHPGYCDGPGATSACVGRNVADSVIGWLNVQPVDMVLLHVGTNNFETNNPNDVRQLLDNIESWAAAHYPVTVFLARTIPSVNGSLDVETYNNNVNTVAQNRPHVRVIRVNQQTGAGLHLTPTTANPSFMGDNLHPNQAGYDRMADKWFSDMKASGVLPDCS